MTAANAYDLLPTIRSRSVILYFTPLDEAELLKFVGSRGLDQPERRAALAAGSPGLALSLDLEAYDRRRAAMLTLLEVAAGLQPFQAWMRQSDAIGRSKSERLDLHLNVLYGLLRDLLILRESAGQIRNRDLRRQLQALAANLDFAWLRRAVARADELSELVRRNIQKSIALDALILDLRSSS
jgi:DNA polymerase-3 subunit delta'